jgi:hypothetical protein
MEYPEGLDWEWFACDRDGELACFVTFGQAPIPKAVLDYNSFPTEDAPDDFYNLTSNPAASWELEIPGLGSFTELAKRGYHVFDWSDMHCSTVYEAVGRPDKPLTINDLPGALKDIVNAAVFRDIAFRDCSVLDVEQHFECSRPPPREPLELLRFEPADPSQEAERYQAGFVDSAIKWAKTIFFGSRG